MRPDGAPRAVPIVHAVVGDRIVFAVDHKRKETRRLQRLADIEHESRVAVLFDHRSEDWNHLWWVRADGTAAIHDERPAVAAELESRYSGYRERPPEGPWVVIDVHRWTAWEAS